MGEPRLDTYWVHVVLADGGSNGGGWYVLTCADSPEQAEANAVACEKRHRVAVAPVAVYDSATWSKLQRRWRRGRRRR